MFRGNYDEEKQYMDTLDWENSKSKQIVAGEERSLTTFIYCYEKALCLQYKSPQTSKSLPHQ